MKIWEVYDTDGLRAGFISPHVDNRESLILRANPSRDTDEAEEETTLRMWTEQPEERVAPDQEEEPHTDESRHVWGQDLLHFRELCN